METRTEIRGAVLLISMALIGIGGARILTVPETARGVHGVPGWQIATAWVAIGVGLLAIIWFFLDLHRERTQQRGPNDEMNALIRKDWKRMKKRERRSSRVTPASELPPPSRETLLRAVEENAWGASRYRARSLWNRQEETAHLTLERRDAGVQMFRVTVTDPTGIEATHEFSQGGNTIADMYPDQFEGAPRPLVSGEYKVRWEASVERDGRWSFEEVGSDAFLKHY